MTTYEKKPAAVRLADVMCLVCKLGAGTLSDRKNKPLADLFKAIKKNPRAPVRVVEYNGSYFNDRLTPANRHFQMYRNAALLDLKKLKSGDVIPALGLLERIAIVSKTRGFCGFDAVTGPAWKGCPEADSGNFQKGCRMIQDVFYKLLPERYRRKEVLEREKAEGAVKTLAAPEIRMYIPHLRCITCWYGRFAVDTIGELYANPADQLHEVASAMRLNPRIPVRFVRRHCMVCPGCGAYDWQTGFCGTKLEVRPGTEVRLDDLRIFQRLGQQYTDVLPAAEVLRKFYTAYPNPGVICGPNCHNMSANRTGRDAGLGFLEAHENPAAVIRRVRYLLRVAGTLLQDRSPLVELIFTSDAVPVMLRELKTTVADERAFMESVLSRAAKALKRGERSQAYDLLVDRHFWNCWQFYLEKVPFVYARLPKTVKTEKPVPNAAENVAAGSLPCEALGRSSVSRWKTAGKNHVLTDAATQSSAATVTDVNVILRSLTAARASGQIVCDGRLTEPAWKKRPFSAGFRAIMNRPALAQAGLQVLYDQDAVTIGWICAERDISALKTEALFGHEILTGTMSRMAPPDDQFRWKQEGFDADDCLAIMIQPQETVPVYYRFVVNTRGVRIAQRIDREGILPPLTQGTGNHRDEFLHEDQWLAAARVNPGCWSAEIRIPFRTLGVAGHRPASWRFNAHHYFRREMAFPESWAFCARRVHDLKYFGRLVFE